MGHEVVGRGIRVVDQVDRGVHHLSQVVGGDVGGHAYGDALAPVDQQVREPGWEDFRFGELARVVVGEVHRVLVDPCQQLQSDGIEAAFGVPGGGRCVVRRVPEVALRVDHWMAETEVLGHTHQGVVDGLVAVRVVLAHDLAGHPGALHGRPVGPGPQVVHPPEDSTVDGLQAVAGVG